MKSIVDWLNDILENILPKPAPVLVPIPAPKPQDLPRKPSSFAVLEEAEKWVGTVEHGGNNKGKEVEQFQKTVDGKAQAEPWCMAFVQYCAKQASIQNGKKNLLYKSELCSEVFAKALPENKITFDEFHYKGKRPEPGWAVIWKHEGKSSGHTGIVKSVTIPLKKLVTIEGNTGPQAGINRDGDGVYEKIRDFDGYGDLKLLGFVRTLEP